MRIYNISHDPKNHLKASNFFLTIPFLVVTEICDEEPENLCTKPQDLSRKTPEVTSTKVSVITNHITTPVLPVPLKVHETTGISQVPQAPLQNALRLHNHQGAFHRVPRTQEPDMLHYAPTTWHRSVTAPVQTIAPQYPPAYFPLYPSYSSAPSNEIYHPYPMYPSPPSPYAPRDSSCSPPMMFNHQIRQPLALIPEPRTPSRIVDSRSSLSPTSSSGNDSPADLSSPPPPSTTGSTSSTSTVVDRRLNSQRHQCPDCGKSYSTFSGLSKHRQFHCAAANDGPRKSFSCKYCDKVYVSLGALKMHIRTHTLPCKCTLCGKAFSRPWLLQGHIRTHTGEKPFSCQHCHRAFADRSNLRAHLQTHSDIKKYSCPTCSKTFSRMSLLTKHAESGGCCAQVSQPQPMLYHQQQLLQPKQEYLY